MRRNTLSQNVQVTSKQIYGKIMKPRTKLLNKNSQSKVANEISRAKNSEAKTSTKNSQSKLVKKISKRVQDDKRKKKSQTTSGTLLSESEIEFVFETFKKQNPHPTSELNWTNPFTLLVAVVLSAQATDKSVNLATADLFAVADTPEKMFALGQKKLEGYIKSIGLYRTKAKHIIDLSKMLIEKFESAIPHSRELLMSLPGVGQKTANVVLNVVWHEATMPVDTHLFRISPKIGIAFGKTPAEVEANLLERIPKKYLRDAHHWLILHGRYICTARNPKCDECIIASVCKKN